MPKNYQIFSFSSFSFLFKERELKGKTSTLQHCIKEFSAMMAMFCVVQYGSQQATCGHRAFKMCLVIEELRVF